ncbi:MAG TPA: NUDIX domain-containing protein [Candidatus Saccharimonadales bacterium]|nr:NUDIX domain-containing protein [Candidatus Saccharimonadales bacterium]
MSDTDNPYTLIGCELFIRKGDMLLLGLRKNCFGAGTWALPGGHLEYNERMVETACREAKEELGADIAPSELRLASLVDNSADKHYIHATFELKDPQWEPQLMEPECCEEWRYFPLDQLPENFFAPHQPIIANYLSGTLYQYEVQA